MGHEQRFASFFESVTGNQPFEWQADLAARLCRGQLPERIDVPTGFGKTSTVHCWAYALATGATVPRRLFFVVDRRLVVDATYDDAQTLETALQRALDDPGSAGPEVLEVARQLFERHGDPTLGPLTTVRMRGGASWESRWLSRPDQPAIVVGTVDQFGSRLLFRGYGASDRMRPVDAALVGTDAWLIIDEAHIAEPLLGTSRSVAAYQRLGERVVAGPLVVTEMSATTQGDVGGFVADLDVQVSSKRFPRSAEAAARRLAASKPVALMDLEDLATASPKTWRRSSDKLGAALAELALRSTANAEVVGVIANTISTARAAYTKLASLATGDADEVVLVTGRCRPFERERIAYRDLEHAKVGAARAGDGRRRFVVTTQTIEVGANLDVDALVTECAPLSSLIQRFGRVNRTGDRDGRQSWIVKAEFTHGAGDKDPVYGDATAATWAHLVKRWVAPMGATSKSVTEPIVPDRSQVARFGLREVRQLASDQPNELRTGSTMAHRLLGAHLEGWASTSPVPEPDQEVAPFIRGVERRRAAEVEVAWRVLPPGFGAATSNEIRKAMWRDWLAISPPRSQEFVAVPLWEARALLAGRKPVSVTSDLDANVEQDHEGEVFDDPEDPVLGVRYRGRIEDLELLEARDSSGVNPGDRILLDVATGGHDRWGWTGRRRVAGEQPVLDVADRDLSTGRPVIRLAAVLPPDAMVVWTSPSDLLEAETAVDVAAVLEAAKSALNEVPGADPEGHLRSSWEGIESWEGVYEPVGTTDSRDEPVGYTLVLRARSSVADLKRMTDEDVASTSLGMGRLSLEQHGRDVGELAAEFVRNLEVASGIARTVELAARWHDLGKADERFQVLLYDGEALDATAGELLAKSGRDLRDPVARAARRMCGLPASFRHEAVSAAIVQCLTASGWAEPDVDIELLRHLVASHHGHARPLMPPIIDTGAKSVEVTVEGRLVRLDPVPQVDWDHPRVFERLNRRYGWWGLALLESLVRLADMRCSEREATT